MNGSKERYKGPTFLVPTLV